MSWGRTNFDYLNTCKMELEKNNFFFYEYYIGPQYEEKDKDLMNQNFTNPPPHILAIESTFWLITPYIKIKEIVMHIQNCKLPKLKFNILKNQDLVFSTDTWEGNELEHYNFLNDAIIQLIYENK